VAIVAGIGRAAGRGVIVKGGGPLETLARVRTLVLDKTGTVTTGLPEVVEVLAWGTLPRSEVLRLAASLDQASAHPYAAALVRAARSEGLTLSFPTDVSESPGAGVSGVVDGRRVRLGKRAFLEVAGTPAAARAEAEEWTRLSGRAAVHVAVDGEIAGSIAMEDAIRHDAPRTIRALRLAGVRRVVLLSGDHPEVAEAVGEALGADRILADRHPEEKLEAVRSERLAGVTMMVGDGINDAAALGAADVGVAVGAQATAASEAADVVITVDRLERLAEAVLIARRSRRIALQSVIAGMALSVLAMAVAAAGGLLPVQGAVLQEAIDVAVILNALRALLPSRGGPAATPAEIALADRFRSEHAGLLPHIERLREAADALGRVSPANARRMLLQARRGLVEEVDRHEKAEEAALYPAVARTLGGAEVIAGMSREHLEIRHLVRRYRTLVDRLPDDGPATADLAELRRLLYSLHAILRLHCSEEDESYGAMTDRLSA
jgi:soluble P-type ATPase/hemerythrin-like domain-containing protein